MFFSVADYISAEWKETNWYNELKEKAEELGIDISLKQVENNIKSTWKQTIKKEIEKKIQHELDQHQNEN